MYRKERQQDLLVVLRHSNIVSRTRGIEHILIDLSTELVHDHCVYVSIPGVRMTLGSHCTKWRGKPQLHN